MTAIGMQTVNVPHQRHAVDGGTRSAWIIVMLLSLMLSTSLLDRQLLAIIASPVAQALHLRDTQVGLLIGTSFAILYSLMSLPVAHGIDRYNRKYLVAGGVALWSVMTLASAFATSFAMLVVFRSGVAVGEAVLMPAAVSMISDLFVKPERALPTTVFTSVGAAMTTVSFLIGGAALKLAGALTSKLDTAPWRLTFALVGSPGLLLAAAFLFTKEPARTAEQAQQVGDAGMTAFFRYLRDHWWFYLPFLTPDAVFAMFTYSLFSWVRTIMIRAHGFTAAQASFVFGFIMTPLQVGALYLWPRLAMRVEKQRLHRGVPLALLIASIFVTPFYIVAPLMTNRYLCTGGICLSIITAGAFSVLPAIRLSDPYAWAHQRTDHGVEPALYESRGIWPWACKHRVLRNGMAEGAHTAQLAPSGESPCERSGDRRPDRRADHGDLYVDLCPDEQKDAACGMNDSHPHEKRAATLVRLKLASISGMT